MDDKLKQLTEKLYKEGIEQGNKKAEALVNDAKNESTKIIELANQEAEKIIANAKAEALKTKENVVSELQIISKQMISSIKSKISDLLVEKTFSNVSDDTFKNIEVIQRMAISLFETWNNTGSIDSKITFPANLKNDLDNFINTNCKHYIDKGLEVSFSDSLNSGFVVQPKDGSYKIDFTDESFINYFKQHLKPLTRNMLFG